MSRGVTIVFVMALVYFASLQADKVSVTYSVDRSCSSGENQQQEGVGEGAGRDLEDLAPCRRSDGRVGGGFPWVGGAKGEKGERGKAGPVGTKGDRGPKGDPPRAQEYAIRRTPRPSSFIDARKQCITMGGDLVHKTLSTATKNYRSEILQALGDYHGWVGVGDRVDEGIYLFLDGTPFPAARPSPAVAFQWRSDQPDDSGGNEDCVHIYHRSHVLNDLPCGRSHHDVDIYGLCEIPL